MQLDKFFKKHQIATKTIQTERGLPLTKLLSELKNSERAQCPIHMQLRRLARDNFKRSSRPCYQVDLEIQRELVMLFSTTLLRKLATKIAQTNLEKKDLSEMAKLIRQRYENIRREENDKYRRKLEATRTTNNPFSKYKTLRISILKL